MIVARLSTILASVTLHIKIHGMRHPTSISGFKYCFGKRENQRGLENDLHVTKSVTQGVVNCYICYKFNGPSITGTVGNTRLFLNHR